MVGNAAAALHGAPVTTIDFDFVFRLAPRNLTKLKGVARELGGTLMKPFYPASEIIRLVNDDVGLQIDFLPTIPGIRSFESLRKRSERVTFGGVDVLVASLEDIIRSKRASGRAKDRAVLAVLEATLAEAQK